MQWRTSVSVGKLELVPDEKLHKCPECRRTFCSMNAMKRHRQSKHVTLMDSYVCALCSACFKTKWSLSTHKSKYHRGQNTSTGGTVVLGDTTASKPSAGTGTGADSSKRQAGATTMVTRIKTRATSTEGA
uniref:C2H2-type domain-containing protein n=1 Tax=Anopheles farauti TaxID=69004 RepID=A0A182QYI9_9DIPT